MKSSEIQSTEWESSFGVPPKVRRGFEEIIVVLFGKYHEVSPHSKCGINPLLRVQLVLGHKVLPMDFEPLPLRH